MIRGLVALFGVVFGVVPHRWLMALGAVIGWFWFYVVPVRRAWCLAHLRAALPDRDDHRVLARAVFVAQVRNTLEMLAWRALERGRIAVSVEGIEHFRRARESKHPVIVVSAHLGNFDLVACHAAKHLESFALISKRLSWQSLNEAWMQTRARFGVHALPASGTMAAALTALRDQRLVVAVMDQHSPEKRAVNARVLGIPARTSAVVGMLAVRTEAVVLPCLGRRNADGSHTLQFHRPLTADDDGNVRERVEGLTQRVLSLIDECIRADPAQWLWLHRRWKDADGRPIVPRDVPYSPAVSTSAE